MPHRVHWSALLVSSSVLIGASCAASDDESGRPSVGGGGQPGIGGSAGVAGKAGSTGATGGSGGGATGGSAGAAGLDGSAGSSGKAGSGGTQGAAGTGGSSGSAGTKGASGSSGTGGSVGVGGSAGTAGSGGTNGVGGGPFDGGPNCTGFILCDDFEDGVADGWTKSGGTWSVLDDGGDGGTRVYQGGNSEESWAGPSVTDQTVEARVKVIAFGGQSDAYRVGIMARRAAASDFYTLQVRWDGSLSIRKSTSQLSGCNAVASGVDPSQWFTLRLKVSGSAASVSLEGAVNGQPKLTCTHSSGIAGGQAGFVTYGTNTIARFDDIRVSSP